jgi:hypothetical protein
MLLYSVKPRPFKVAFKFRSKRKSAGGDQRCRVTVELLEIRAAEWLLNCWREIRDVGWLLKWWREIRCRMPVELLERDQRFKVAVACYREIRDMGWLLNCWREIRDLGWLWPATERLEIWDGC